MWGLGACGEELETPLRGRAGERMRGVSGGADGRQGLAHDQGQGQAWLEPRVLAVVGEAVQGLGACGANLESPLRGGLGSACVEFLGEPTGVRGSDDG